MSILREGTEGGGGGEGFHPAARLAATHCIRTLETGRTETTTMHVLGMLKDCLANMNTLVSLPLVMARIQTS